MEIINNKSIFYIPSYYFEVRIQAWASNYDVKGKKHNNKRNMNQTTNGSHEPKSFT